MFAPRFAALEWLLGCARSGYRRSWPCCFWRPRRGRPSRRRSSRESRARQTLHHRSATSYHLCTDPGDATQLTDGKTTTATFGRRPARRLAERGLRHVTVDLERSERSAESP